MLIVLKKAKNGHRFIDNIQRRNSKRCKTNKGAFSLSVLRSIVLNILHLNKVENISRKITDTTYDLAESLMLFYMVKLQYGIIKC